MANLVKYTVGDPIFKGTLDAAPLGSDWNIAGTAGNLDTSGSTFGKAGTGGSGSNVTMNVSVSGTAISSVQINNPGVGYKVGDTITFSFTSADSGFIGNCDIICTPTIGGEFAAQLSFPEGYFDADKIIGYTVDDSKNLGGSFGTTIKKGSGGDYVKMFIQFSGLDNDSQEQVDAVTSVNEAIKDAWQNPNSIPSVDDYLPDGVRISCLYYE